MITTIRFDVHGGDAREVQENAVKELSRFSGEVLDLTRWTVQIEVAEEMGTGNGHILSWRGEVVARRHDPQFIPD